MQHFFLDDDEPPAAKGTRPDRLADVRPQERVPQRIVEKIVDSVPVVPLLHTPVPQEALKILDKLVPDVEQVIEDSAYGPAALSSPGAADGRTVGGSASV